MGVTVTRAAATRITVVRCLVDESRRLGRRAYGVAADDVS